MVRTFIYTVVISLSFMAGLSSCSDPERASRVVDGPIIAPNPEAPPRDRADAPRRTDANPGPNAPNGLVSPTRQTPEVGPQPRILRALGVAAAEPASNAPKWINLATLEVQTILEGGGAPTYQEFPDKTVRIDVGVEGTKTGTDRSCRFIATHPRIRTNKKWSPLPIVIFTQKDSEEKLSPLFEETLDFPANQRTVRPEQLAFLVEFTRKKVFRALWRVKAEIVRADDEPTCGAHLEICITPKLEGDTYTCPGKWRQIERLITVIHPRRHIRYYRSAERDKDDLVKLRLVLRDLDPSGHPTGDSFTEEFVDFTP